MSQSRLIEWNPSDRVSVLLDCQAEQELTEMLQNPEVLRKRIEEKQKEAIKNVG